MGVECGWADANDAAMLGRLLGWQLLSLLLTVTGVMSSKLAALGVDVPTAQSVLVYVTLALHWVPLLLRRQRHHIEPTSSVTPALAWWQWLTIAAADVEANYLLVRAYQYTNICSVTVLDAFTVPTVMALSFLCLRVRFTVRQCAAASLCLAGIVTLFASDLKHNDERYPLAWLGDVLVLAGAALYGVSNVVQEHVLKARLEDRVKYLAHLGSYGAAIALVQSALLERDALPAAWHSTADRRWELVGLEAGFVAALVGFYIGVATLLEWGSTATTMNLSLLTSDFWSVAAGVTLLHSSPGVVYALAFCLVVVGLGLYHWNGEATAALGRARWWRAELVTADHEEHDEERRYYERASERGELEPRFREFSASTVTNARESADGGHRIQR